MKLILCEDVDKLGHMGDTVTVADGYARNFLVPRKLAVPVSSASAKQVQHELGIIRRREEKLRAEQSAQARKLEGVTVEIKVRAGEGDKIFGSVTGAQIAEQLVALGHEIDKKAVLLKEHIKELGIFTVPVRLGKGIEANVRVWVSPLEPEKAPEEAPAEAGEEG
ncbi:MAG TPA: 50S ribosomal protein L9 [Candidatus Hydrogenedentes bacterium]|nr:50S ribosomal protein L9 [Candidatus Hydrogenedentota bacterium]HNT88639.1 50S ribosomal protein L9 [Candidatus Hydrogenedentota bacterium]